jgi:PAS domain S-box-containing protein
VERVSAWLLDEQAETLVCQDLYKLSEGHHEEGPRLAVADFKKYLQAMEASRIVAADDAVRDPRTVEFAQGYLQEHHIVSMMDVPIRMHGKLIGVLCHEHVDETREWTLEEQDFVASISDMITNKLEAAERRKAQLALRESEHRYRTLLTNIPQKIFYKDLNAQYLLCNKSYADDLGIDPDQIRGKTDFDFHPRELAVKYIADDKRIISTGEAEEIEEQYIHQSKALVVRTLKSPVRDEEGNIIGIFGIFWDITARKQAEDALAQLNEDLRATVEELQRSNKELQDFAYVTAHDLKSPLRAIGTLTDWIYTDYEHQFNDQAREQMQLIKGRVSRMNELIDGILRYSEIGRGARHLQEVNLQTLVPEIIQMVDVPENVTIDIVDSLPTMTCEKSRIMQVFHNLIHNAVKFMDKPEGRIEIGCIEQEQAWVFRVKDNGPGIDVKYHEKIFRMFQTLAPRDELESAGIGLAVVKKIVEIHGGKVWVESKTDDGCTFMFTLPKQSEAVKSDLLTSGLYM